MSCKFRHAEFEILTTFLNQVAGEKSPTVEQKKSDLKTSNKNQSIKGLLKKRHHSCAFKFSNNLGG